MASFIFNKKQTRKKKKLYKQTHPKFIKSQITHTEIKPAGIKPIEEESRRKFGADFSSKAKVSETKAEKTSAEVIRKRTGGLGHTTTVYKRRKDLSGYQPKVTRTVKTNPFDASIHTTTVTKYDKYGVVKKVKVKDSILKSSGGAVSEIITSKKKYGGYKSKKVKEILNSSWNM